MIYVLGKKQGFVVVSLRVGDCNCLKHICIRQMEAEFGTFPFPGRLPTCAAGLPRRRRVSVEARPEAVCIKHICVRQKNKDDRGLECYCLIHILIRQ